jgi:hypothetical protein
MARTLTEGQRNVERNDLAGFELAGEGGADAILAEFGGASPAVAEFAVLKHADLETDVDGKAREAANVARGWRLIGLEFFAWSGHKVSCQPPVASCQFKVEANLVIG